MRNEGLDCPSASNSSDKAVELLAFFSLKDSATFDAACVALWPSAGLDDAAAFFKQTVDEINRVVREATGNPSPVIVGPGGSSASPEDPPPRIMVRVLTGKPYVEVCE
jgi:hypothetical protein